MGLRFNPRICLVTPSSRKKTVLLPRSIVRTFGYLKGVLALQGICVKFAGRALFSSHCCKALFPTCVFVIDFLLTMSSAIPKLFEARLRKLLLYYQGFCIGSACAESIRCAFHAAARQPPLIS